MTWFRASGAIVATYWSEFVPVRMAHTENPEKGMSSDARTTNTHATVRPVRDARVLEVSWAADLVTPEAGLGAEFSLYGRNSTDPPLSSWVRSMISMQLTPYRVITHSGVIAAANVPLRTAQRSPAALARATASDRDDASSLR